ncbi:hypothetical protein T01_2643 [Trichinella spiralis]|uniref:Uncharacterized protein n=1 Tax=Trichinella spiralis TaxID=6334 RepID=A0A0V1ATC9_TRISP|nr:hypothetical protein T01_2643 [Trichinella spiralis]
MTSSPLRHTVHSSYRPNGGYKFGLMLDKFKFLIHATSNNLLSCQTNVTMQSSNKIPMSAVSWNCSIEYPSILAPWSSSVLHGRNSTLTFTETQRPESLCHNN